MSINGEERRGSDCTNKGMQVSIFPDLAKTINATAKLTKSKREKDKQRAYRKNKLFRRIEADIKERERKRIPGRPEHYVDRDRLIAVSFYGQVDIRQQMLKQRSFLTRRAQTSGSQAIGGIFNTLVQTEDHGHRILIEQAVYEIKKGSYDIALKYLDKALSLVPEDADCMIYRGSCLVQLQQYDDALNDVNSAMNSICLRNGHTKNTISKAYTIKGDAYYHLGEFEKSLMFYYRALHKCQSGSECEDIRVLIRRSMEAIDNSVGMGAYDHFIAMPALLNKVPGTIFGMSWSELRILKDDMERENLRKQTSDSLPLDSTSSIIESNTSSNKSADRQHRRKLLGKLSKDMDYLENLIGSVKIFDDDTSSNRNLVSFGTCRRGSEVKKDRKTIKNYGIGVRREAQDAILFLKRRQEFWSQLKPMYCNNL